MVKIDNEFLKQRPLSFSSLKEFAKSPRHYIQYISQVTKPTPAMLLGSMVHTLLLEPHKFADKYAVAPELDKRTKEGKAKYEEFASSINGQEIVSSNDRMVAEMMAQAVKENGNARNLIEGCQAFEHQDMHFNTGLPFKYILDGVGRGKKYILEVKTCQSSDPEQIKKDFFNRKYYLQAGMYSYFTGIDTVYFIAVESNSPYNVTIFKASNEWIEYGVKEFKSLAESFAECMSLDLFDTGYEYFTGSSIIDLELPGWVK